MAHAVMTIPIPIHNAYCISALALLGAGSFQVANYISGRWTRGHYLIEVNLMVKSAIVLLGLFFIPITKLFSGSIWAELGSLPIGLAIGSFVVFYEKKSMRSQFRSSEFSTTQERWQGDAPISNRSRIQPRILHLVNKGASRIVASNKNTPPIFRFHQLPLITILSLACVEEIIFRGFLTIISFDLSDSYLNRAIWLLMTTLLFGLSHIMYGAAQFKSKLLLSILALISFISLKTILCAIFAHTYLNFIAHKEGKKWAERTA